MQDVVLVMVVVTAVVAGRKCADFWKEDRRL